MKEDFSLLTEYLLLIVSFMCASHMLQDIPSIFNKTLYIFFIHSCSKAHRPSDTVRSVCIGIVLLERPGLLMAVPVLLTLSSSQVCLLWQEPLIAQLPQPQPQLDLPCRLFRITERKLKNTMTSRIRITTIFPRFAFSHVSMMISLIPLFFNLDYF